MSIQRTIHGNMVTITFVLDDESNTAPASVVGSFNDWTPGAHPFERSHDGGRAVTIEVPTSLPLHFRYLAADGVWSDDEDADEVTDEGSFIWAAAPPQA
ncbi:MAG TPA: hypothetical protein VGD55_06620 [Acidothermaceae bacterium]